MDTTAFQSHVEIGLVLRSFLIIEVSKICGTQYAISNIHQVCEGVLTQICVTLGLQFIGACVPLCRNCSSNHKGSTDSLQYWTLIKDCQILHKMKCRYLSPMGSYFKLSINYKKPQTLRKINFWGKYVHFVCGLNRQISSKKVSKEC